MLMKGADRSGAGIGGSDSREDTRFLLSSLYCSREKKIVAHGRGTHPRPLGSATHFDERISASSSNRVGFYSMLITCRGETFRFTARYERDRRNAEPMGIVRFCAINKSSRPKYLVSLLRRLIGESVARFHKFAAFLRWERDKPRRNNANICRGHSRKHIPRENIFAITMLLRTPSVNFTDIYPARAESAVL